MSLPALKDLKKLANFCRKAGIQHFKTSEFEFTLNEDVPETVRFQKASKIGPVKGDVSTPDFKSDLSLTEEQLWMWSSSGIHAEES